MGEGKRVSWVELSFALLITAAGVGLLLEEDPPRIAYGLACIGAGIYLAGTRAFLHSSRRMSGVLRALVLVATFFLAQLEPVLSPHEYLWLLAVWIGACAALTTRVSGDADVERLMYHERAAE